MKVGGHAQSQACSSAKKPRGEGVGEKKSDAKKISAINDPENQEGKHPLQF